MDGRSLQQMRRLIILPTEVSYLNYAVGASPSLADHFWQFTKYWTISPEKKIWSSKWIHLLSVTAVYFTLKCHLPHPRYSERPRICNWHLKTTGKASVWTTNISTRKHLNRQIEEIIWYSMFYAHGVDLNYELDICWWIFGKALRIFLKVILRLLSFFCPEKATWNIFCNRIFLNRKKMKTQTLIFCICMSPCI